MPVPGEQFKRFFPGLVPVEEAIWRRFLLEHEMEFDRFEYNVFVGEGVRTAERPLTGDTKLDEKLREQFRRATQRKVDVVAIQGGARWVFEVEERPGARALGQVLIYAGLLPRTFLVPGPLVLAVVGERIQPDTRPIFEALGVRVFIHPPPPRKRG